MCGIFGMVSRHARDLRHPEALSAMGATIRHRGPDGSGCFSLPHVAIGVNRLRIQDLDPRADQPLKDLTGQLVVALNGEIYNAAELRREFPRYPFRTTSDAEVLLPLLHRDGTEALSRLEGMFALATWDEGAGRLVLARDRAGEKPLFYVETPDEVLFASEIQALLAHPDVSRDLDDVALGQYLALGYIPEPRTPFASIRKLEADRVIEWSDGRAFGWSMETEGAGQPGADRLTARPSDRLLSLLTASVHRQLRADVPVGVFLSGGLDSSLIAALAAREGVRSTFTVRFSERSYDEGDASHRVARHLGSSHVDVEANDRALALAFETISSRVAEPIADPAILPTWLLADEAKRTVGVVLAGEGADELFGGYPAYLGHKLAPWVRGWLPLVARLLPQSPGAVPLSFLVRRLADDAAKPWLERHVGWMGTGLTGLGIRDSGLGSGLVDPSPRAPNPEPRAPLEEVMALDYRTYLRDRLLPKIDRATMLASLEARAPYLDRAVTAFAQALPASLKVRGLTTKWVLKKAAETLLPRGVVHRRKRGLSVPISGLLNHTLRSEVDHLLAPSRLARQGLLNASAAGELLRMHRAGDFGVARGLWAIVVFQAWMENWKVSR